MSLSSGFPRLIRRYSMSSAFVISSWACIEGNYTQGKPG